MQPEPTNRGGMSQVFATGSLHRTGMTDGSSSSSSAPHEVAPAARDGRRAYDYLSSSSVGLELGISVLIGLLFGYWLDRKLGSEPWLMILFLVLGFVGGMRGVIRAVKRADRAAERDAREAAEAARG